MNDDRSFHERTGALNLLDQMQVMGMDISQAAKAYNAMYSNSVLSAPAIRQPVPNQAMADFSVSRELRINDRDN